MRPEYEAIVEAGFDLQLDCPDLAMARHTGYQDLDEAEFLRVVDANVEALNAATAKSRPSACACTSAGATTKGRTTTTFRWRRSSPPCSQARPATILFEAANPRHEHEWIVWRDAEIPDDKKLAPGLIDTCSNYVEHPELIAQRIERYIAHRRRRPRHRRHGLRVRHLRRLRQDRSRRHLEEARGAERRRAPRGIAGLAVTRRLGQAIAHTSNPPPRLFPVRIAQAALEDLARLLARQRVGKLDHARHLVVGDALAQEARTASRSIFAPLCGCTCAASASPNSASGMPNTAQSATSGMVISTASISAG